MIAYLKVIHLFLSLPTPMWFSNPEVITFWQKFIGTSVFSLRSAGHRTTPTAAQWRAALEKPSTMVGETQGAGRAVSVRERKGGPLVPAAHTVSCAILLGAEHRFWPRRVKGSTIWQGRERGGLAGNRLAVCIKTHAFSRLASNIKIIHGGLRTGMQCTGHMFGTPAHDGWLWLPVSGATN